VNETKPDPPFAIPPVLAPLAPLAPALMMGFWMLLGAAAGIKLAQSLWQLLGWGAGGGSVAVPVGAVLGRISNPRLLVLLMAVFAGSAAGGVAGKVAWGEVGEVVGQVAGGSVGGLVWAVGCTSGAGRHGTCKPEPCLGVPRPPPHFC
jgi:hypothetical protein